ncbi:cell wall hydrolase [Undibacter mobilis]|uniref:Cell wall hydrolase n=2 Tax=Undibacter mobilis TaxID=2292256 RepID=A0A371BDN1_9BRAD|nr:cell wall hydrolase [Undibacter mobilis]
MNANALTNVAALIRDSRLHYDELPDRVLAGIRQISIYNDRSSVVVAIPRDVPTPKPVAQLRPAPTLNDPVKLTPVAAERQRLALNKPEPVKTEAAKAAPTRTPRTAAPTADNAAVAALADVKHADAVELAMLQPAGDMRPGMVTLASLTSASPAAPTPAVAIKPDYSHVPASQTQAMLPAADYDDAPPVRLASLNAGALPVNSMTPEAMPISLPPLSMVPLPVPAPGVPPPSPAQRLNLDDKEYAKAQRCLANAIYWEARSEPVRGQMAVAQVVMNRVFSPFYPNDVCGVVYQNAHRHLSCQFTFACDGKRKTITERGHWARANRIAKQTLDGQIYVPEVAKSTHYHASYVNPIWNREMKKLVKFGLHSFYRPYAWGTGEDMPTWGKPSLIKTAMARHETGKKK